MRGMLLKYHNMCQHCHLQLTMTSPVIILSKKRPVP